MVKYIFGVDGGNTKTDYFLFDVEGNFIDFLREGTCSHERLPDSFEGSYVLMKEAVDKILSRNNLKPEDIAGAVFGLAGVDTQYQKERLTEVVGRIGFKNYEVVNDSFLPIKASTRKGSGVCAINGTGTSVGGIDDFGRYLQVGGIGSITGDEAGGSWLSRRAIRAVYETYFMAGKPTILEEIVFDFLGIDSHFDMMDAIVYKAPKKKYELPGIGQKVFACARQGDEVSIELLKTMADNLAKRTAGCVVNLDWEDMPDIVLAGSVWVKGDHPVLISHFKEKLKEYTQRECNIIVLTVPPATGAIVWAKELAEGEYPNYKTRMMLCDKVQEQLDKIEGNN